LSVAIEFFYLKEIDGFLNYNHEGDQT